MSTIPTPRSLILSLRNYHHYSSTTGIFESWDQVVNRVITYQKSIWQKALKRELHLAEKKELGEIKWFIQNRYMSCSGRHLLLSSPDAPPKYECGFLNSTFIKIKTVADVKDIFWLLLNGCGTGFYPEPGVLKGFRIPIQNIHFEVIDHEYSNTEEKFNLETKTWIIRIGHKVESWVKSLSHLLSGYYSARTLIFYIEKSKDEKNARTHSFENLIHAFTSIANILSNRSKQLLNSLDILDIINLLGLIPANRRSSQIALFRFEEKTWIDVLNTRKIGFHHRSICNNSVIFERKPSHSDFELIFQAIQDNEGCQPGIVNGEKALKKAPWFQGFDSCVTTLLPNKGACTLSEINLLSFRNNIKLLKRVVYLTARMNYRQSFLNLDDGILQKEWHTNNEAFRLCGVGLTGVALAQKFSRRDLIDLNTVARLATCQMAKELGTVESQLITCIKPSGNLSKIMGCNEWGEVSEGIHVPQSKYIFNKVIFSKQDPILKALSEFRYEITPHPFDAQACLVKFPIKYKSAKPIRSDSAINQLERYKKFQTYWSDHNISNTIFYKQQEIKPIIKWLDKNWNAWLGLSFHRIDSTTNHYAYLPQEKVEKDVFYRYCKGLKEIRYNDR